MKSKAEVALNSLLALTCLVVIVMGVSDLYSRYRVSGRVVVSAPPAETVTGDLPVADAIINRHGVGRVALVEFSDYQCPFCGKYAQATYSQIDKEFVQPGKISYVFVNYPLEQIHPLALRAAEAAECASEQNRYWEMHDSLFEHQTNLQAAKLSSYASSVGLEMQRFEQCMREGRAPKIRRQIAAGEKIGVQSTPTFFVAMLDDSGHAKLLRKIKGAQTFETFRSTINEVLSSQSKHLLSFAKAATN